MTREQLQALFPRASESFLRDNADSGSLGGRETAQRKRDPVQALERRARPRPVRKARVAVVITIIGFTNAFSDDDNIGAGAKSLRDCIAASLGVDDGDKRLKWEYVACQTAGREQYLVRIQLRKCRKSS